MSNIIINAYTGTPPWEYTADFSTETGWTKSGSSVGFSGGKMQFTSVAYSLPYTGSRGTEYWTTLWRESATSSNFRVWSDSSRATNVHDSTFTINSGIISLDNMIGTGQMAGVPSRTSIGYITELSWKDEVNVDS